MAAGFDLVNLSYTSVVQTLSVSLGNDSDQATVYASSARNLSVDAGNGYDAVRIEYSATDHLFASLGDGGDSLAVVSSLARMSRFVRRRSGLRRLALQRQPAHRTRPPQLRVNLGLSN